jgi:hypothetical protein
MSKLFQVYGIGQALIPVLPPPVPFQTPPTVHQTNYEIGQVVFTPPTNPTAFYMYGGGGNWIEFATNSGDVTSVTGTANQILAAPTGGAVILSLVGPYTPATYTAHGVLVGEGTGSIVATAAGTTGQVLTATTAADPAFAAIGTNSGLTIHGVVLAENTGAFVATGAGTNGQVFLGSTGADPAFGTLTTTTGMAFTTGAASLALNVKTGGYNANAASTGGSLVAQNSYVVVQAGQTSFALPASSAVGDSFLVAAAQANAGGWIITQGAGQEIWLGTNHTTSGATGTLAGARSTSVVLMCTVANVEFVVVGGTGVTGLTFV